MRNKQGGFRNANSCAEKTMTFAGSRLPGWEAGDLKVRLFRIENGTATNV